MKGIKSLEDYVKSIDKETFVDTPQGGFTVPAPKISYTMVEKERAISVTATDSGTGGQLSSSLSNYVVVKNGWVYKFVFSGSYDPLKNKEDQEIFQKIISSVKFL